MVKLNHHHVFVLFFLHYFFGQKYFLKAPNNPNLGAWLATMTNSNNLGAWLANTINKCIYLTWLNLYILGKGFLHTYMPGRINPAVTPISQCPTPIPVLIDVMTPKQVTCIQEADCFWEAPLGDYKINANFLLKGTN